MRTIPRIRINGALVPFVGRVWSHLLAQGHLIAVREPPHTS